MKGNKKKASKILYIFKIVVSLHNLQFWSQESHVLIGLTPLAAPGSPLFMYLRLGQLSKLSCIFAHTDGCVDSETTDICVACQQQGGGSSRSLDLMPALSVPAAPERQTWLLAVKRTAPCSLQPDLSFSRDMSSLLLACDPCGHLSPSHCGKVALETPKWSFSVVLWFSVNQLAPSKNGFWLKPLKHRGCCTEFLYQL